VSFLAAHVGPRLVATTAQPAEREIFLIDAKYFSETLRRR
jgi:hypothetical protein